MRLNTASSIRTASSVHSRFGSWKAAKASSDFKDGKFVVRQDNDHDAEPERTPKKA